MKVRWLAVPLFVVYAVCAWCASTSRLDGMGLAMVGIPCLVYGIMFTFLSDRLLKRLIADMTKPLTFRDLWKS